MSADQWVTAIYDMIAAFKTHPDQIALVKAFKGLYFGRTLPFMNKTWDMSSEEAEKDILVARPC